MFKRIFLTLFISFFVIGCDSPSASEMKNLSLEETKWSLVSFGRRGMDVPKNAWIRFKDGKYRGSAGCNGMSGEYSVKGDKMILKAGMSTMMACADMRLETKFRQSMSKVTAFKIEGDTLMLMRKDQSLLNFIAK